MEKILRKNRAGRKLGGKTRQGENPKEKQDREKTLKKNKKARTTPGDKETTLRKNKVGRKPKIRYWCENCYIPLRKHVFAIIIPNMKFVGSDFLRVFLTFMGGQ
jgi:hypothetical protein